jgi:hypothetical protein
VVGGGRTRRAAALGSHEADCRDLNASTRLNPTLSLAVSMRRIAGRSLNWRTASWTRWSEQGAAAAAMAVGAGGGEQLVPSCAGARAHGNSGGSFPRGNKRGALSLSRYGEDKIRLKEKKKEKLPSPAKKIRIVVPPCLTRGTHGTCGF